MNFKSLLLFLVALSLPLTGFARENFYVELSPGISFLTDVDIKDTAVSFDFDSGFVVGGAIGLHLTDTLRAEVNVSYRETPVNKIKRPGGGEVKDGTDASATMLMFNTIYDFPVDFPVTPYVGMGMGVAFIETNRGASCTICLDGTDRQLAWNLMAGGSIDVIENVTLSAGYRYLGTTAPKYKEQTTELSIDALDPLVFHEIVFGLRYSF